MKRLGQRLFKHRLVDQAAAGLAFGILAAGCSSTKFASSPGAQKAANATAAETSTDSGTSTGTSTGTDSVAPVSVQAGGTTNLGLPGSDSGATCVSSDPTVATVDAATCAVTGVKPGTTQIIATLANGTKITVPVTVLSTDGTSVSASTPQFALLLNDVGCTFCHVTVNGDIVSTGPIGGWEADVINFTTMHSTVTGNWYAAGTFTASVPAVLGRQCTAHDLNNNCTAWDVGGAAITGYSATADITVNGQPSEQAVKQNFKGAPLPHDANGNPAFPQMDLTTIATRMKGTVVSTVVAANVVGSTKGNIELIGTKEAPIKINGDVYIDGMVIIKGYYQGIGTIYASQNIYVPGDLRAVNSAFLAPGGLAALKTNAVQYVATKAYDALGLATPESILIADLTSQIYDSTDTPSDMRRAYLNVDSVYGWLPQAEYQTLYENVPDCTGGPNPGIDSFSLLESYLYAGKAVVGIARQNSYALNGGAIANALHIIALSGRAASFPQYNLTESGCLPNPSPVHGMPMDHNYINYDWRMANGLNILGEFAAYFK